MITKYECENCGYELDDEEEIFTCEECGLEICIMCMHEGEDEYVYCEYCIWEADERYANKMIK